MRRDYFRPLLYLLYAGALSFVVYVLLMGWDYYVLPLGERPHSYLHIDMKPGGLWGHGLGILGSVMILLLFIYSLRKREMLGLRFGKMRYWLNVHIFFGIMGPIFITLHTSFKFNGIVSISYFSMLAVMFSGILGRYIYMQIPRDPSGMMLTLEQISSKDRLLTKMLVEEYKVSPQALNVIKQMSGAELAQQRSGLSAIITIFFNDLKRPFFMRRLGKALRTEKKNLPRGALGMIVYLAKQKSILLRKCAFLDSVTVIFHYWHVIHKPFAYVMIIIMFLHVIITVTFGSTWIF